LGLSATTLKGPTHFIVTQFRNFGRLHCIRFAGFLVAELKQSVECSCIVSLLFSHYCCAGNSTLTVIILARSPVKLPINIQYRLIHSHLNQLQDINPILYLAVQLIKPAIKDTQLEDCRSDLQRMHLCIATDHTTTRAVRLRETDPDHDLNVQIGHIQETANQAEVEVGLQTHCRKMDQWTTLARETLDHELHQFDQAMEVVRRDSREQIFQWTTLARETLDHELHQFDQAIEVVRRDSREQIFQWTTLARETLDHELHQFDQAVEVIRQETDCRPLPPLQLPRYQVSQE